MPVTTEKLDTLNLGDIKKHQTVTPVTDGAETVFITPDEYEAGTLEVFRDQSALQKGAGKDFLETSSTTFTLASAPDADEDIWVHYVKV